MMNDNFSAEAAIVPEGGEAPVYRLEAEILTQGPDGVSFDFDAADVAQQVCLDYRGIDRTTDVLSFPAVPFDAESDFSAVEENEMDYIDPDTGILQLGDIVINASRVWEQAQEYGHSPRREFAFLVAHSMLHLCGYDHMTPEESARMEAKQEAVLQGLGITRS